MRSENRISEEIEVMLMECDKCPYFDHNAAEHSSIAGVGCGPCNVKIITGKDCPHGKHDKV